MTNTPMIELKKVSIGYRGQAVATIDRWQLQPAQSCLVKGPSGCGKSTLLHCLAGLMVPLSGSIRAAGLELNTLTEAERDAWRASNVGIVFQTLHLVQSLTVMQNMLVAPLVTGQDQDGARAQQLLEQLSVAELADRLPSDISQGQAQRVAIARAFMNQPAIVLADEPSANLDDAATKQVIALLKKMAKLHQTTLIVASHDQRLDGLFDTTLTLGDAS